MVMKMRRYADGGKVELPPKSTRVIKPVQLPPPKPGPKPKAIKRYADGGKVAVKFRKGEPRYSAMDAVRGTIRRKREQELGLKDGGKVKRKR